VRRISSSFNGGYVSNIKAPTYFQKGGLLNRHYFVAGFFSICWGVPDSMSNCGAPGSGAPVSGCTTGVIGAVFSFAAQPKHESAEANKAIAISLLISLSSVMGVLKTAVKDTALQPYQDHGSNVTDITFISAVHLEPCDDISFL
jgi:hypothetical protein